MEGHVKIVAILNIVLGGLGALAALVILLTFGGVAGIILADQDPDAGVAVGAVGLVGMIAFVVVALFSLPSLIGGIGLLSFREWARILTIITSVLNLLHIPFGTALGVYGLWVLLNNETIELFKAKNTVGAQRIAPAG